CTITFVSGSPGKVAGHATSTLSVLGAPPFTVATDGVAPNRGDAVKTYVDANIQISPPPATDRVGAPHTLPAHVNANGRSGGGFKAAPDGTQITFAVGPGAATFVGGVNQCTTSGGTGSCSVQINSTVTGANTITATTTVTVGGIQISRTTGDTHAGDSAPASK